MKKRYKILIFVVALFLLVIISDNGNNSDVKINTENKVRPNGVISTKKIGNIIETNQSNSLNYKWIEYENNPIIEYKDIISNLLWNDPSVIKEDGIYKMWLSGGDPIAEHIVVKIYYGTSNDGINWYIDPNSVFEASEGMWDSESVETPSVIKVGDTYHLYYTGYSTHYLLAEYSIGHATSKDGINWIKDPNNPVISPHTNPLEWGFNTVAEPAIIYYNDKFHLYYTSAKSDYPEPESPFGIMLATSDDGSSFTDNQIVYSLTSSYDRTKYRGYSTPAVYIDDKNIYLYHDIVYDPEGFEQIGISSAISSDGINFEEYEFEIIMANELDWKNNSVIGPTVLLDGDELKMWFAGVTYTPRFNAGIGLATLQVK
jgi:predicted GH43/DUF377 family glycosyl hydrolase